MRCRHLAWAGIGLLIAAGGLTGNHHCNWLAHEKIVVDMELLVSISSSCSSPSTAEASPAVEPVTYQDPAEAKSQRQVITETLQQLRNNTQHQCEHEAHLREEQGNFTKSVVKIMHLDTKDYDKIVLHARAYFASLHLYRRHGIYELTLCICFKENVTQQNAIAAILDRMKALEAAYQLAKKDLAAINDKCGE